MSEEIISMIQEWGDDSLTKVVKSETERNGQTVNDFEDMGKKIFLID